MKPNNASSGAEESSSDKPAGSGVESALSEDVDTGDFSSEESFARPQPAYGGHRPAK